MRTISFYSSEKRIYWKRNWKNKKTINYLETLEKKRSVIYKINEKKEYLKLLKDILYEKIKLEIIIYSILWLVWLFYLILIIKIIILLINW